jgi:hypothetical protein
LNTGKYDRLDKSKEPKPDNKVVTLKNGNLKIKKRSKFTTYPKSCIKTKSQSCRFDRQGIKIDVILKSDEGESESDESRAFHISFKDQVSKKSLIKVFEVESFKKYNTDSQCSKGL